MSLSKSEIDAIFDEIDFKFYQDQKSTIVNETCKPKQFKARLPVFNLNIGRIKDELKEGAEVEVRYGYFIPYTSKFIPGVPKEAFYNLLEAFLKKQEFSKIKPVETIDYIVGEGKTSVRIMETKGKRTIQSKTRLDHKDIPAWGFRISASKEEAFSNPEKEMDRYGNDMTGKMIRRKVRYTFPMVNRQWDLTIVTDPKNPQKDPIFEVEIEYNSSASGSDFEKRIEKDFKNGLQLLYKTSNTNILSMRDLDILINNYNNLFDECNSKKIKGRFFEIENKPGAFKFSNIFNKKEYHVTPKLDGLRKRIFIDVNGIFVVNPGTRYAQQIAGPYAPTPQTAIADTIIDTEYYDKSGEYIDSPKYFPFDVLIFDGASYFNKPFSERIATARAINLPIFDFSKPFFKADNFFESYSQCVEWQDENPDIIFDGQIAQVEAPPYKSFLTMKIKPPKELTIDLYTEIDDKGVVTFKSYTSAPKSQESSMKVEKFGNEPIKWKEIRGDGPKKIESGFIGEYNLLEEHPFLKFKGFRRDKIKPNFSSVVDSVRHSFYIDPITEEDLLGESLLAWRKWANYNKRNEITTYIPEYSRILDIGIGRGGTLLAAAKRAETVYGIDPDEKNINKLWKRIEESSEWDEDLTEKVQIAIVKGQETEKVMKFIGTPVNAALSMFSLSFFFKSEKDLDGLIATLTKGLKISGSVVLFNFMDGLRVGTALKESGQIQSDLYTIKIGHKGEKYDYKKMKDIEFGIPISIKFENEKDPIFKYQEEWLANFDILLKKMNSKGFQLIKDSYLDIGAVLPESNLEFAKFNRTVIFQRGVDRQRARPRPMFKEKEEQIETLKELGVGETEVIKFPTDYLESYKYLKQGKYVRHGVTWDESSFLRSFLYLTNPLYRDNARDDMVEELRKVIADKLTKKVFKKLKAGNVENRLAFDKLYTRVENTGKIIGTESVAKEAGYFEYMGRVASGPIGHEISLILTMINDVKLVIVDNTGRILDEIGKGEEHYIMKIGDYAYSPLDLDEYKSAKSE